MRQILFNKFLFATLFISLLMVFSCNTIQLEPYTSSIEITYPTKETKIYKNQMISYIHGKTYLEDPEKRAHVNRTYVRVNENDYHSVGRSEFYGDLTKISTYIIDYNITVKFTDQYNLETSNSMRFRITNITCPEPKFYIVNSNQWTNQDLCNVSIKLLQDLIPENAPKIKIKLFEPNYVNYFGNGIDSADVLVNKIKKDEIIDFEWHINPNVKRGNYVISAEYVDKYIREYNNTRSLQLDTLGTPCCN